MEIQLLVVFPAKGSKPRKEKSVSVAYASQVDDAIKSILDAYGHYLHASEGDQTVWKFFNPASRCWLEGSKSFDYYEITNKTKLELRNPRGPLAVDLRDGSSSTFEVDHSKAVKYIIREITKSLRIETFAETYGLLPANTDGSMWLLESQTLAEQGIVDGVATKVILCKRFFNRSQPIIEEDVLDEQMAFHQCKHDFLTGKYDDDLTADLQSQLAALLLLIDQAKPVAFASSMLQEKAASISAPKWRKKLKSDLSSSISTAYSSLQSRSLDQRALMKRFTQTMVNFASFGSSKFELKTFRSNLGKEFLNCVLRVDSSSISVLPKASSDSPSYEIPSLSITKVSANKSAVAIQYKDDSNAKAAATINCDAPALLRDTITGCMFVAQQRAKKLGKSSQRTSSNASPVSPKKAGATASVSAADSPIKGMKQSSSSDSILSGPPRPSMVGIIASDSNDFDAIMHLTRDLLLAAEQEMADLVAVRKQAKSGRRRSDRGSSVSSAPASIFFTQAASHLSSAMRSIPSIVQSVRVPETFSGIELRRFETVISNWSSSICSIATCLSGSSDSVPVGLQTIAATAQNLIHVTAAFTHLVPAIRTSFRTESEPFLKAELAHAERALTAGCIAVDLALQDLVSDEPTAISMMICLRDIESSTSELVSEAIQLIGSDDRTNSMASDLRSEVSKARATFSWYRKLLSCANTVHCAASPELEAYVAEAVESIGSAANSLLRVSMELNTDQYEGTTSLSDSRSRIRFHWSSLTQSLTTFSGLASATTTPFAQTDPMLPPVINTLWRSVDDIFSSFTNVTQKTAPGLATQVASRAHFVVRTLANMVSVEPSPTILIQAAKIESAIDRLRAAAAKKAVTAQQQQQPTPINQSRENPNTVAKKQLAIGALAVLDSALVTVSDIRGQDPEPRERVATEAKLLVMTILQLRSSLRCAASLFDRLEFTDSHTCQTCMEQLDALLHEFLPVLDLLAPLRSGAAPGIGKSDMESLLSECEQQIYAIADSMHAESGRLGIFTEIIVSQRHRLKTRIASCKSFMVDALHILFMEQSMEGGMLSPLPAPLSPSKSLLRSMESSDNTKQNRRKSVKANVSSAEIMKRMSSRRKLLTRPEIKSGNRASVLLPSVQEGPDPLDMAFRETSSAGDLEYVNEAGLLDTVGQLVELGEPKKFHLSYKDALELCLTTFPYWTTAASVVAVVVAPFLAESIADAERQAIGARVSVALSRLMRYNPFIVNEPSCRMVINNVLVSLKSFGGALAETGAKAIEDTITDCVEVMVAWDKLHADMDTSKAADASDRIDLLNVDLQHLANQMTLVEQRFFEAVSIPDLIRQAWMKNTASPLALWVSHCNDISRWVASRIIQTSERKDRAKLISRMLKLAELLQDMNNFSGMISIYLALAMDCVGKLNKTWAAGAGSLMNQFTRLSEAIRPLGNFSGYRETLKKAVSPGIPYMAVLMKDMVTMEELLKSSKGDGQATPVFDVGHLETVTNIIHSQFVRFRKAKYRFDVDPKVFREVFNPQEFGLIPEDQLNYRASLLEKDKRRDSQRMPPIAIKQAVAAETMLPRSLAEMLSPKTGPIYGLRSQQEGSSSLSNSTSSGDNSPTNEVWKNHTMFCLAQLQEINSRPLLRRDTKAVLSMTEIADKYSANMANDKMPSRMPPTRPRRISEDDNVVQEPIADYADAQTFLLPLLRPLGFKWAFDSLPAGHMQYSTSHSRSVLLQSIALEVLLALVKTLGCFSANPIGGQLSYNLKPQEDNEVATVTYSYTITFATEQTIDIASAERAVLSLLSPPSGKKFVTHGGRFSLVSRSGSNRIEATIQLVSALQPVGASKSPTIPRSRTAGYL